MCPADRLEPEKELTGVNKRRSGSRRWILRASRIFKLKGETVGSFLI